MNVHGQLVRAQLEVLSSNPAALVGRVHFNSTDGKVYISDATTVAAMLRNDDNIVIGTSGTAAENIRLHRGAANVLQAVEGDDVTVEGTLSTALNQLDNKLPNFTTGTRPAVGNAGRTIWNTTDSEIQVDTGAVWDSVAGSTATIVQDARTREWVNNIGFSLSAGVFKIVGSDGTVFSAPAPGSVTIRSTTSGQLIPLQVTTDVYSFIDDVGASDIVGEEFGVTSGVAWGEDRPFFVYAVNSDDTDSGVEFAISPDPTAVETPATTNIGYHGNPAATPADINFFFLTATDVTATHDAKPCLLIGGIRMQMSSLSDWTVQALNYAVGDGVSSDPYSGKIFKMPTGQNGAVAGEFLSAGGDTLPSWATPANIAYDYILNKSGSCEIYHNTGNAGSVTNGTGTNAIVMHLPYAVSVKLDSNHVDRGPIGAYTATGASVSASGIIRSSMTSGSFSASIAQAENASINSADWTNTGDDYFVRFTYRAFGN